MTTPLSGRERSAMRRRPRPSALVKLANPARGRVPRYEPGEMVKVKPLGDQAAHVLRVARRGQTGHFFGLVGGQEPKYVVGLASGAPAVFPESGLRQYRNPEPAEATDAADRASEAAEPTEEGVEQGGPAGPAAQERYARAAAEPERSAPASDDFQSQEYDGEASGGEHPYEDGEDALYDLESVSSNPSVPLDPSAAATSRGARWRPGARSRARQQRNPPVHVFDLHEDSADGHDEWDGDDEVIRAVHDEAERSAWDGDSDEWLRWLPAAALAGLILWGLWPKLAK